MAGGRDERGCLLPLVVLLLLVASVGVASPMQEQETTEEPPSIHYTEPSYASSNSVESGYRGPTELPGGRILRGSRTLERLKSPYVLREDLYVERDAELRVEAGVEVRFAPMIGITVRGIVVAEVGRCYTLVRWVVGPLCYTYCEERVFFFPVEFA